jgi:urease accessory protein
MSVAALRCDRSDAAAATALAPVRAAGGVAVEFKADARGTAVASVSESGGYRVRFPHSAADAEAVLINTGGGMAGGDRLVLSVIAGARSRAVATTQAAERIYRSLGPCSEVEVDLRVAAGASLAWLPQETLLYSGARLRRRLEIDLAAKARLLLAECLVFGRAAMGETMEAGLLDDRWRLRRSGRLAFAEAVRIDGPIGALLERPAVAAGGRAVATLLYAAGDAEARLAEARAALGSAACGAAVSAWNGLLVARFIAVAAEALRADVARLAERLHGAPMPRVWWT